MLKVTKYTVSRKQSQHAHSTRTF